MEEKNMKMLEEQKRVVKENRDLRGEVEVKEEELKKVIRREKKGKEENKELREQLRDKEGKEERR